MPAPVAAAQVQARVIIVQDAGASETFAVNAAVVRRLVQRGLVGITRKPDATSAWRSLVSAKDVVGFKVYSNPGPASGTRPAVVAALVESLIAAGHPARQIVIWDRYESDLRAAGYFELAARYGVRVKGANEAGYDESQFYESPFIGQLIWGDLEFRRQGGFVGRKSFVTKLLTGDITKIINVTPLLNHNRAGVTGALVNLALGSVDNSHRFEVDAERLATAVPEIFAMVPVADRVVLNVVDAIFCQYFGEHRSLLHYSTALNQLRFSTDPVALDILSLEELDRQRLRAGSPVGKKRLELYYNASLLDLGVSELQNIRVENAP
ncbi:hypothetical protein LBMAG56_05060 [Verrucomicrobiota bacterium]|nr:hypothetical protein LBMAG56_05060 [Verrucomicrobiota bacterium]